MWWGSGSDPSGSGGEGSSKEPPQNQQLRDLQEQFEQQQTFIAQLKEMLRKTEQSSFTREKVEEYASTLNEINARAKRSKFRKSEGKKPESEDSGVKSSASSDTGRKTTITTPAKVKIDLLRQQVEENRMKLAQRDKNKKGIEEMVNQLKAQLDDSQNIIIQSQFNIPKPEVKTPVPATYTSDFSKDDLLSAIKSKDEYIEELNSKLQQVQANFLDLQENVKEKDSVIEARTKAITLLSENLSKKGKNTLDMLDETKEQMRMMQQNFVSLETKMKDENTRLQSALDDREKRIQELLETNSSLKTSNLELQEKLTNLDTQLVNAKEELLQNEMNIQELQKINDDLQNRLVQLEDTSDTPTASEKIEQKEVTSPQKTSKRGKGGKKLQKSKELSPSLPESDHLARIAELEKLVEELKIVRQQEEEKQQSVPVCDDAESDEIAKLNKQLEEMNKNMIKMKAQHKAKVKEMQKKAGPKEITEKVSNLEQENVKLTHRVAELEDEKGNLQLRLVDYESNKEKEYIADLEHKIEEQQMEIENHIRTITSLESQISSSSTEITSLRNELTQLMHIENAQVCSEMTSVQLEEQLDKEVSQKKEIQDSYNAIVKENEALLEKIENLNKEKQELSNKLDSYMQENIDLIDRLEKLSAEKVSSAESIEIVESLTQQEKMEIEAYQKNLDFISDKPTCENIELEPNSELNESVSKLSEETSELMERIELFTVERREVMDKMDNLTSENQQLGAKLEKYEKEKAALEEKYGQLCEERDELLGKVDRLTSKKIKTDESDTSLSHDVSFAAQERDELVKKIEALTAENEKLLEKHESLTLVPKDEPDVTSTSLAVQERDELMKEIDKLTNENVNLLEKIKSFSASQEESEVSSTALTAHEELQKEISEYRALIENQNLQIFSLQEELWNKTDTDSEKAEEVSKLEQQNTSLKDQLSQLQTEYDILLKKSEEMKASLKTTSELVHEKEEIEKELVAARKKITELEKNILVNVEEINDLQILIEDNKNELIKSADSVANLQIELSAKMAEVDDCKTNIEELNYLAMQRHNQILEKDKENTTNIETVNFLTSQLQELKRILAENIDQLQRYERETNRNTETIESLYDQLERLNDRISDMEHIMESKNLEINTLKSERVNNEAKIKSLEGELKEKNDNFGETCRQLKEKCKFLENQIQANTGSLEDIKGPFEAKITELENKNKEQVDKMKKIAANLKKKAVVCQELETKLAEFKEKWENESKEKDVKQKIIDEQRAQLVENEQKVHSLLSHLRDMENELSNLRQINNKKNSEFEQIQINYNSQLQEMVSQNSALSTKIQEYENASQENEKLKNELSEYVTIHENLLAENEEKKQEIESLKSELNTINSETNSTNNQADEIELLRNNFETSRNAMEAKLQEKELYIENLEMENVTYKEKTMKLEEGLSTIEERRQILEERELDLKIQLEAKASACEEASQSGDFLEQRLAALIAHDDVIEKKLQESTTENMTLHEKVKTLVEKNTLLQKKLSEASQKLDTNAENVTKMEAAESENMRLAEIVSNLEQEMKKMHAEYEETLKDKQTEIESMETELNAQVQELNAERKNVLTRCEMLEDNIKEYIENEQLLNDEMDELKQELSTVKQELDNKSSACQELNSTVSNNVVRIQELEIQLQNVQIVPQESGAQGLKLEVDRLQKLIAQKDVDIQNYQRQNMQLQMASLSAPSTGGLFDAPSSFNAKPQESHTEIEKLKNSLLQSQERCTNLEQQIHEITEQANASHTELFQTKEKLQTIEERNTHLQNELDLQKSRKESTALSTPSTTSFFGSSLAFSIGPQEDLAETEKLKRSLLESQEYCASLEWQIQEITQQAKASRDELLQTKERLVEVKRQSKYVRAEAEQQKSVAPTTASLFDSPFSAPSTASLFDSSTAFDARPPDNRTEPEKLKSSLLQSEERCANLEQQIRDIAVQLTDSDVELLQTKEKLHEVEEQNKYLRNELDLQKSSINAPSTASLFDSSTTFSITPDYTETDKRCADLEQQIHEITEQANSSHSDLLQIIEELQEAKNKLLEVEEQNRHLQNELQVQKNSAVPSTASLFDVFNVKTSEDQQEIQNLKTLLLQSQERSTNLEQQIREFTIQINASVTELAETKQKLREAEQQCMYVQNELEQQTHTASELQQELLHQQELLVRKAAEQGVSEIILTAEKTVSANLDAQETLNRENYVRTLEDKLKEITGERDSVPVMVSEDIAPLEEVCKKQVRFDTSAQPESRVNVDNKEELLRKIKALEFMLFNVEQEKDATLAHCHEFINELTRLVYEREKLLQEKTHRKPPRKEADLHILEGQILTGEEIADSPEVRRELQSVEYPPVHIFKNEDVIQPQKTYLCFTGDNQNPTPPKLAEEAWGWGAEDSKIKESIESQIVSMDDTKMSPEEKKQFQLLEFSSVHIPKASSNPPNPVCEEIPDPKSAYLCYPGDSKNVLVEDTFASEEDGWGWNAEEAKLEAEHRQTLASTVPQSSASHSKIEQLEEKIHDLEVERSRLLEEIKTSQVRSGKLIKKLKDMKQKNDSLTTEISKKSSNDFYDLDMAIQDELNTQIKALEKKIKELTEDSSKEKAEKENLLKRIDVLTAANERMVEQKEKQDNEMQFLNFKNRELSSKLEQLEWGDDSFNAKTPVNDRSPAKNVGESDTTDYKKISDELNKKINELNVVVNDLTLDNEDMQCMLEEQRNLRKEAEKALSSAPAQDLIKIESENKSLQEEVSKLAKIKQVLEDRVSQHVASNEELVKNSSALQLVVEQLTQENTLLNCQLASVQSDNKELQVQLENLHVQLQSLQVQLESLNSEKELERKSQYELQNKNKELENSIETLLSQKEAELKNLMERSQSEILQLNNELTALREEKLQLERELAEKDTLLQNLNMRMQQLETEKSALELKTQEILNIQRADKSTDEKLEQMNEQLMSILKELDVKNKELSDLTNMLNSERLEFEQKFSASIEQLAREWSERVEQRGNDVAESWKLHFESVQNEFSEKERSLNFELSNVNLELNNTNRENEELLLQNNELREKVQLLTLENQNNVSDRTNIIENLQHSINNKQVEIEELTQKLQDSNALVETKNNEIISLQESVQLVGVKDIELNKLKTQMIEKEEYYEEMLSTKDSDLDNLRSQLSEQENRLSKEEVDRINLQTQLEIKIAQCDELEGKINELNILSQEESSEMSEMRELIESQVLKIEELKQHLYEKSNDYDALVAEFDSLHLQTKAEEKHVHFEEEDSSATNSQSEMPEEQQLQKSKEPDLSEPVSRAELDLALYMLHQRDVRCEELTVELMQLLEERDTLQLRLSNAIRINEELRNKLSPQKSSEQVNTSKESPKTVKSTGAIPKSKSTAIVLGATGTELATEATENITADASTSDIEKDELASKLSQLHKVGYRDKTIKEDQEIRHIQQMSLMQQHRDLASRLPPEAAARLVDASYTLSRDVQSPSKVLLNWLWGRSTPKVNDV